MENKYPNDLIKISFRNNGSYNSTATNAPITTQSAYDVVPIGVITEVTEETVFGVLWKTSLFSETAEYEIIDNEKYITAVRLETEW